MPEKIKRNNIQIIGMNLSELEDLSEKFDQSRFRGRQLFNSVYKHMSYNAEYFERFCFYRCSDISGI